MVLQVDWMWWIDLWAGRSIEQLTMPIATTTCTDVVFACGQYTNIELGGGESFVLILVGIFLVGM